MIFNLNEQKVLSDPSGSSVFKGEKDFNDIVVNLPDNIDGHTATELNYVMHFVNSDGGYSTKILTVDSSGETLKATATVSTNITSKAQAFYAYVLMTDDEETVIGKTNGVIVMIHPVPDEESEIIPPADADEIIKGLEEIVKEATETIETATDTIEEATEAIGSKQDKLTAGENITIDEDNVISAEGSGVTSYNDLTDKPCVLISDNSTNHNFHDWEITNEIRFAPNQFYGEHSIIEGRTYVYLDNLVFRYHPEIIEYDFNRFTNTPWNGCLELRHHLVSNFPNALNKIDTSKPYFVTHHFNTLNGGNTDRYALRKVSGYSRNGDFIEYAQICFIAYDVMHHHDNEIISQTDWVELTGGSQIVSGVVNANGTITFTDSNGNTFTTTGSSVIGPQGDDYVLTAQDKSDIADIVLGELPTTQGVLYGNQSN